MTTKIAQPVIETQPAPIVHAIPRPAKTEAASSSLMPIHEYLRTEVSKVLNVLNSRECEIIKLRYGLQDGYNYTLQEVSDIFKICKERVRQLEAGAIHKLQRTRHTTPTSGKV